MTQNNGIDDLTGDEKDNRTLVVNKRRTVRYIRKDIEAHISKDNWFGWAGCDWFHKEISVQLLDISNRGCLIACTEKLAVKTKITVLLTFGTGKRFEIKGIIVRKAASQEQYGIKFAEYNDALGEYMLKTQEELTFK